MAFANALLLQLNNRMRGVQAGGLWTMQTGRCATTTPAPQEAGAPQSVPQPTQPPPPPHPQIPHRRTSHHPHLQQHSTHWSHFNSHDAKWKVFGVVHVTTATLVIAYLTMLFSCLTTGLQIAILCSDNDGTWGFSRYSFNGFHTRQQNTDQRSLMISANHLQQSGSSSLGNPTSFDDHFLLQNHPMPTNSELRNNLLASLQSTTISPLALASNVETVGDIDTPNVHHGVIRSRQTQDQIRRLGTEQTINMCVLTMLIYGVKTQRRWFLLPHLINAAIVMMTKFMVTFGGVFTSGGAGSASSPSSDGDYYAPVQYHAMSTGMIMLFINLFAFLIPFRCFVYFTERDRASTAGPFANYDAYLRTRTGSDDSLLASAAAAGHLPNDHRNIARIHRRSSTSAMDASSATDNIPSPPPYPHYAVPPVYAQGPPAYDTVVKAAKTMDTNTTTTTMLVRPISDETGDAATSSNELVDETTTMTTPDSDQPTAATRSRSQINVNQHQLEVLRKQSV